MFKAAKFITKEAFRFGLFVGAVVLITTGPELVKAIKSDLKKVN